MEIFNLRYPFTKQATLQKPVVLAMGFFDGVHKGHQAVLDQARQLATANGLPLAVLTYNHHPKIVFDKMTAQYQYLGSKEHKYERFAVAGVDVVYEVGFTSKLGHLAPQAFVDEVLIALEAQIVVAGDDHTYGIKEKANMTTLPTYAAGRFKVVAVPHLDYSAHKIGSTVIRELVDSGNVDLANELLGYDYQTTGIIVHGEALGRTLGFPTANVLTPNNQKLPGVGVYGVRIKVAGKWYYGDASVGYNQTIGDNLPKTVEIFIFDFHEEIYGEEVIVEWSHHVRDMVKFDGLDALIDQLNQDEADVRQFFAKK